MFLGNALSNPLLVEHYLYTHVLPLLGTLVKNSSTIYKSMNKLTRNIIGFKLYTLNVRFILGVRDSRIKSPNAMLAI
jgi:hypothetical protein